MKARVIATEEANSTRTVSLVIVYVTLGTKKINALRSYCGDLITALARKDGRWEIAALRKNAEKLLKRIVAFFDDSVSDTATAWALADWSFHSKTCSPLARERAWAFQ